MYQSYRALVVFFQWNNDWFPFIKDHLSTNSQLALSPTHNI